MAEIINLAGINFLRAGFPILVRAINLAAINFVPSNPDFSDADFSDDFYIENE